MFILLQLKELSLHSMVSESMTPFNNVLTIVCPIGETFCQNGSFDESEVGICQKAITGFMPPALKVLMGYLKENANNACAQGILTGGGQ